MCVCVCVCACVWVCVQEWYSCSVCSSKGTLLTLGAIGSSLTSEHMSGRRGRLGTAYLWLVQVACESGPMYVCVCVYLSLCVCVISLCNMVVCVCLMCLCIMVVCV